MSLRQALAEKSKPVIKGPPCSVKLIYDVLDEDDQQALDQALADPRVRGTSIVRALEHIGHNVKPHSLNRHRRGSCVCGTS